MQVMKDDDDFKEVWTISQLSYKCSAVYSWLALSALQGVELVSAGAESSPLTHGRGGLGLASLVGWGLFSAWTLSASVSDDAC